MTAGSCQTSGGSTSRDLDTALVGAEISLQGSQGASDLIGARLKARGLKFGQQYNKSKRADFSCNGFTSIPSQLPLSTSPRNALSSALLTVDLVCRYQRRDMLPG